MKYIILPVVVATVMVMTACTSIHVRYANDTYCEANDWGKVPTDACPAPINITVNQE